MADRFSNPSAGEGVDRFHVWPAGTDSYDHVQNAENWDLLDSLLGIPTGGPAWPPTTGVNGGIYREVTLLQNGRVPIGTVIYWFRPNEATSIPDGWAVCDGSTLTVGNHDFPGGGSVVLPDLINRFVLGADPTKANGAAAAAVTDSNVSADSGAPGAQATGGENSHTLTIAEMPAHSHTLTIKGSQSPKIQPMPSIDTEPRTSDPTYPTNSAGGGVAHENRPRWIGLIAICYVKHATSI